MMEQNRRMLHQECATLAFYMQGGININDAYLLSIEQRSIMSSVIEKHHEAMSGKANSKLIG